MMNKKQAFKWMVTYCLSFIGVFLMAQNEARVVTNTYVIKNAIVVQKPGMELPPSHVVVRNGLIEAIGANVAIPFDAQIIDADSMYVYAGFIDAASHTGIPKVDPPKRPDGLVPGNPPNDLAGITPEQKAADLISSIEKSVKEMRDNGFTISHVVPSGRMLPGKGAIIVNSEGPVEEITINSNSAMFAQLRSAPRMYPATVIGVMAKWRDLYNNAKTQSSHADKYSMNPVGMNRPVMDDATAAMMEIVDGSLPVFFKADKAQDIFRIMRLKNELGFQVVFTDVEQAGPALDILKSLNTTVLITSDLPKEEKEKKDDEKEEDPEKTALEKRKAESQAQYVGQAAMLEKEGIPFAFSFIDGKVKDFKKNVLRMIKAGLSTDAALAALTTTPAGLMGLDKIAGTVETGKMANLVITDKPYFDEKSNIRYVLVDGHLNKYEVKEKKKKSGTGEEGVPVAMDGEWSYEIEIPGQVQTGKMVISKNGDDYEIKFASSDEPDDFTDANNVEVDGSTLTFDATVENGGFSMNISFDLEVEEESFEGTVTAGNFGSFPISGDKTSTPE